MQESTSISVVCVCDNHYVILLAALLKSIEVNHISGESLIFHIVEDGISEANRIRLINSVSPEKVSIMWYSIKTCIPHDIKLPIDNNSLPANIYARLFISSFLPLNISKVIYLDVDMIMLRDISDLWKVSLENKICAAVQDQFIQIVSRWGGVPNYEELHISKDNKYFNSGLMIIDLHKWREAEVPNRVINCIEKNKEFSQFGDQYGLNAVLFDNWLELNPKWNLFAYSNDDRPYLIHFTGRKPIYKSYNFSIVYKEIFYGYLNQTLWNNFKPISEVRRYWKKIMNVVHKFIRLN